MKPVFTQESFGDWFWRVHGHAEGVKRYTREADAKRGYQRYAMKTCVSLILKGIKDGLERAGK